jgi:predicted dehydrogenase
MRLIQGSPNEKVRLAIIGCGGIGRHHYNMFTRHGGNRCEIIAICDPYRKQIDEFQAMAQRSFDAYSDYRRILERRDIDAVVVATPDHWHARITIDACEAGKHVYVEKPASHNVVEGLAMVNAAREHKRVVMVGLAAAQWRTLPRGGGDCPLGQAGQNHDGALLEHG